MKAERAIEYLRQAIPTSPWILEKKEYQEAFDLAIEALKEKTDRESRPCSACVHSKEGKPYHSECGLCFVDIHNKWEAKT